jgi:molybdopterin-binding protein
LLDGQSVIRRDLGLAEGVEVTVLVKSTDVGLAVE